MVLQALARPALVWPARYRLIVVPGSGCTGWLPVANQYFSGLLHAELLVLHKPGVNITAGLAASCQPDFIQNDALSSWTRHARAALQAHFSNPSNRSDGAWYAAPVSPAEPTSATAALPVLLVGISEGAELLPYLAPDVPNLAGMVMIAASGLDPRDAGELQARRLQQQDAWHALAKAQLSGLNSVTLFEGRTLHYWQDMWRWRVAQPLLQAPWPLLRVWGDADEMVPLSAYQRFLRWTDTRQSPFCDLRLKNADHGLQSSSRDGVQWLWAQLEIWARHPTDGLCARAFPP